MSRLFAALVGLVAAAVPSTSEASIPRLTVDSPAAIASPGPISVRVSAPLSIAGRIVAFEARVSLPGEDAAELIGAFPVGRGGRLVHGDGVVGFYRVRKPRRVPQIASIGLLARTEGLHTYWLSDLVALDRRGRVVARRRAPIAVRVQVGNGGTSYLAARPERGRALAAVRTAGAADSEANIAADPRPGSIQALQRKAHRSRTSRRLQADSPLTFTVNTTWDSADAAPGDKVCRTAAGTCSLRAAVDEGNRNAAADTIRFNIPVVAPATWAKIQLGTFLELKGKYGGTTVDGYTQPGSAPNTHATLSNAALKVEVVGPSGGNAFVLSSYGNVVRGLSITGGAHAIYAFYGADNDSVLGNWIGFDPSGAFRPATKDAISVDGVKNSRFGSPQLADRNVVAGTTGSFKGYTCVNNTIQNNLFGIGPTGTPHKYAFVDLNTACKSNLVGGTGVNEANRVGPSRYEGIELSHGWNPNNVNDFSVRFNVSANRVIGNWIGFAADGSYNPAFLSDSFNTVPNGRTYTGQWVDDYRYEADGINVYDGANGNIVEDNHIMPTRVGITTGVSAYTFGNVFRRNVIGYTAAGLLPRRIEMGVYAHDGATDITIDANTIGNADAGVVVRASTTQRVRMTGQRFEEVTLPIDLAPAGEARNLPTANDVGDGDVGANTMLNYPLLTSATPTLAAGTTCASCGVEIYRKAGAIVDRVATATADATGAFSVALAGLNPTDLVGAMAVAADGTTSELSPLAGNNGSPFGQTIARDEFNRTVAGGLGSADEGGAWEIKSGAAYLMVDGTRGRFASTGGSRIDVDLPGAGRLDTATRLAVSIPVMPTSDVVWMDVVTRRTTTGSYRVRLRVNPTGGATIQPYRSIRGVETPISPGSTTMTGVTFAASSTVMLDVQQVGATIRMRWWQAGGALPTSWPVSVTDSSPDLQFPGSIGLRVGATGPAAQLAGSRDRPHGDDRL